MQDKPINIFWTGGWDSTFRVLQHMLIKQNKVQPFFIIRPQDSVGFEIDTMINLRRQIFRNFPNCRNLLLPTKYFDIREIKNDQLITKIYEKISNNYHIAKQYEWLARFCKQKSLDGIELCIIKADKHPVFRWVSGNLSASKSIISDREFSTENEQLVFELFKFFKFPIIHLTKLDMKSIANENKFEYLLYKTWFCATPFKGKPCGFCGPCIDAMKMGFSQRIPIFQRLLSFMQLPFRDYYRRKFKNY